MCPMFKDRQKDETAARHTICISTRSAESLKDQKTPLRRLPVFHLLSMTMTTTQLQYSNSRRSTTV